MEYGQKKSRINRCGLPCYPHENTHNYNKASYVPTLIWVIIVSIK